MYRMDDTRYVGVSRVLVVDPESLRVLGLSPKAFLSRLHSLRTEMKILGFGFPAARTEGGSSSQTSNSPSSV